MHTTVFFPFSLNRDGHCTRKNYAKSLKAITVAVAGFTETITK